MRAKRGYTSWPGLSEREARLMAHVFFDIGMTGGVVLTLWIGPWVTLVIAMVVGVFNLWRLGGEVRGS